MDKKKAAKFNIIGIIAGFLAVTIVQQVIEERLGMIPYVIIFMVSALAVRAIAVKIMK